MKVKDLAKLLDAYNPDLDIVFGDDYNDYYLDRVWPIFVKDSDKKYTGLYLCPGNTVEYYETKDEL